MCDAWPDDDNDGLVSAAATMMGSGDGHPNLELLSNGKVEHIPEQNGGDADEAKIESNNGDLSSDGDGEIDDGKSIKISEIKNYLENGENGSMKNTEILAQNCDNLMTNTETFLANSLEIDPHIIEEEEVETTSGGIQYVDKSTNDIRCVDADGWEDLLGSGRLRKRVLVEGDPKNHPAKGFQVKVHFKGTFEGHVFEESEFEFCVQEHEVISALNLVVPLMNFGEKCEVIADPEFAYGKVGFPPVLPPNAAIHAEVTLLECRPPAIITDIPLDERLLIGQRKKERGNFWYSRKNYSEAVQCYRRAVEYFDDERLELEVPIDRFSLDPELQHLLQDRLKTYNNLAQAQMKLEAWEAALASIKNVLRIEPNNEKALYRKSKCLEERGQIEEAIGILRRITRLYPDNKTAGADLSRLSDRRKKNRLAEERMSKRMLGLEDNDKKASDKKSETTKTSFLSNKQWIALGVMMGGAGIALGGFMSYFSRSHGGV